MTTQDAPRPQGRRSGQSSGGSEAQTPRTYPVSLLLLFPEGRELTRGSIVLKNGPRYSFDYYTLHKKNDDLPEIISNAVSSILRQAPGRPVRYMVHAVNRNDYSEARRLLDDAVKSLNIPDAQYGSSHMPTDALREAAIYARQVVDWRDLHHNTHSYVVTLGTGNQNYTAVINLSSRNMRVNEITAQGGDPAHANLTAIRDLLTNRQHPIAVWSSIESVNLLLQRKKAAFNSEAAGAAKELIEYVKSRELELSFNAMAHPHVVAMGSHLCVTQYERHLRDMLRQADETPDAPARTRRK